MDAPLRDQIRYLELRLGECEARPALHRHQIAAYQRQLELARGAAGARDYLRAIERTASALDVPRAEWMDRYHNWSCVYRALGDDDKHRAAMINYRAAERATGADLLARISAAKLESAEIQRRADAGAGIIPTLLVTLLDWAVESAPATRDELRATIEAYWAMLQENDPGCTWKRVCEHAPYRHRIPFDGARMELIGSWLRAVVGPERCDGGAQPERAVAAEDSAAAPADDLPVDEAPADAPAATAPDVEVPTPAQAALAYHLTRAALDPADPELEDTRQLYQRIAAMEVASQTGPELLRRMAEDDMYTRLARAPQLAVARRALARGRTTAQPHMEHHYQTLIAALERCQSPTEVEYEVERLGELHAVEIAWSTIFLRYATRAIMAAIACQLDPGQRSTVATSYRLVSWLFGVDWDDMLRSPRVQDFVRGMLYPAARELMPAGPATALLGEVGVPAAASMREATIGLAIEQLQASPPADMSDPMAALAQRPVFASAEAMRDHITHLFRQAVGTAEVPPGPASHRELVLWGRRVHLDDLLTALASPPRPEIALEPTA